MNNPANAIFSELVLKSALIAPERRRILILTIGQKQYVKCNDLQKALGSKNAQQYRSSLRTILKALEADFILFPTNYNNSVTVTKYVDLDSALKALEEPKLSKDMASYLKVDFLIACQRVHEIHEELAELKRSSELTMENKTTDTRKREMAIVEDFDIDAIGAIADAVIKVYGVSRKEALKAATMLKAAELNRDLSPLLDMEM